LNVGVALGLFIISFISNATPFFGASYTLPAAGILLKSGVTLPDFLEAVLITAVGASLSKNVMYLAGFGTKAVLSKNKNVSFLQKFADRRSFYWVLVLLAFLPLLPLDDFLYIGGGAVRASPWKVNAAALIGKLLKSFLEIALELEGLGLVGRFSSPLGLGPFRLSLISTGIFVVLSYVLLKLDWQKEVDSFRRRLKQRRRLLLTTIRL